MSFSMNVFGVGPRFVFFSLLICTPFITLRKIYPDLFQIKCVPYWVLATLGILLLIPGTVLFLSALRTVYRDIRKGKLCTAGAFAVCRHPLYASWVVFLVPGMILIVNSWIGIFPPILMYFLLLYLVREEESYMEQTFGEEYLTYARRVPPVLPIGWFKRSPDQIPD